jgi:hypothetical protein
MRGEAVGEAGHFLKKKIPSQITSFNPSRGRSYKEYQICCVFKRKLLVSQNRGMLMRINVIQRGLGPIFHGDEKQQR